MDANAAFLPLTHGVDLAREIDRLIGPATIEVPASVRRELERLRVRRVELAAAALAIADRFPSAPNSGRGDRAILELARSTGGWVVTADRELREQLVEAGVGVLFPRDRDRLDRATGRRAPRDRRRRPDSKSGNG